MVWLAFSNTEQIPQDIKVHIHFSRMKIYPITLNTFFVVLLHKQSWKSLVLGAFFPHKKKNSDAFIDVRSQTTDVRTWITELVVMWRTSDLCFPRVRLVLQLLQVCGLLTDWWDATKWSRQWSLMQKYRVLQSWSEFVVALLPSCPLASGHQMWSKISCTRI